MQGARKGRSRRARIGLAVFRLVMAVVIVLFAWRTYEEVAIAHARSSGTLERADAVVVDRTEEHGKRLGGTGQDRTTEWVYWDRVTLELRVNGELQSVEAGGEVGDHVQVGLWHGHIIELDGFYVWQGWGSGLGGYILVAFYPLAMGYLITLTVTARVWTARRGGAQVGDPVEFVFEILFGIIVGAATIVPLALVPAALGTEHPRFWPLVPVVTGATATLLVMRRKLRRGETGADRTGSDDAGTEGAPARS